MSTTRITKGGTIPGPRSEMNDYISGVVNQVPFNWGLVQGDRVYAGGQYCDNRSWGVVNGDVGAIGRMSLPRPIQFSGDSSTIIVATAAASYGSGTTGE